MQGAAVAMEGHKVRAGHQGQFDLCLKGERANEVDGQVELSVEIEALEWKRGSTVQGEDIVDGAGERPDTGAEMRDPLRKPVRTVFQKRRKELKARERIANFMGQDGRDFGESDGGTSGFALGLPAAASGDIAKDENGFG